MLIVILVIIGLSILILGHEAGHFFVAKLLGMKIEEFGFGFPPRIFGVHRGQNTTENIVAEEIETESVAVSKGGEIVAAKKVIEEEIIIGVPQKRWQFFRGKEPKSNKKETLRQAQGNTVYSVNWLPFGGFVKIAGENDRVNEGVKKLEALPEKEKRGLFCFRPWWQRSLVILAGVTVNFLIGWFLISAVLMMGTPKALVIAEVQPNSPASTVGVLSGDVVSGFTDAQSFIQFTNQHRGEEITLSIMRSGKDLTFKVVPRILTKPGEGAIGVALAEAGEPKEGFFAALRDGFARSTKIAALVFVVFYNLIKNLFLHASLLQGVAGPVGIFAAAEQTSRIGFVYLMELIGLISINLAVVNLVPFPALDGGRFIMILIEKIKGRPIPRKAEALINNLGFAFLILLMILITVRDVGNLL